MVKKFMQHSCNTSITRRVARGSIHGLFACGRRISGRDVALALVVSFGVKMIDEVSERLASA
jgi:hypothetical protein